MKTESSRRDNSLLSATCDILINHSNPTLISHQTEKEVLSFRSFISHLILFNLKVINGSFVRATLTSFLAPPHPTPARFIFKPTLILINVECQLTIWKMEMKWKCFYSVMWAFYKNWTYILAANQLGRAGRIMSFWGGGDGDGSIKHWLNNLSFHELNIRRCQMCADEECVYIIVLWHTHDLLSIRLNKQPFIRIEIIEHGRRGPGPNIPSLHFIIVY